jgi:O-succinylbenzoate synthase
LESQLAQPFEIHDLFDQTFPMTIAGLENALCDLYYKSRGQNTIQTIFSEKLSETVESGAVLGDLPLEQVLDETEKLVSQGCQRIKLKISPHSQAFEKLSAIRTRFPDLQLAVDANQSYQLTDWQEIQKLDPFQLTCIEEPFNLSNASWEDFSAIKSKIQTPSCFDESVQTMAQLKKISELPGKSVLNIKIGRLGGLYPTKQAIDFCRNHDIDFWIGSMVESGISKILHIQLSALAGTLMAGDLSDSDHYFEEDLIRPEIKFSDGKMTVPTGAGIGVEVNEEAIERYSINKKLII